MVHPAVLACVPRAQQERSGHQDVHAAIRRHGAHRVIVPDGRVWPVPKAPIRHVEDCHLVRALQQKLCQSQHDLMRRSLSSKLHRWQWESPPPPAVAMSTPLVHALRLSNDHSLRPSDAVFLLSAGVKQSGMGQGRSYALIGPLSDVKISCQPLHMLRPTQVPSFAN